MGLENDRRMMAAKIETNVASERIPILRIMPLFIKNIAMKAVFDAVGECKSCLCMSNLGGTAPSMSISSATPASRSWSLISSACCIVWG